MQPELNRADRNQAIFLGEHFYSEELSETQFDQGCRLLSRSNDPTVRYAAQKIYSVIDYDFPISKTEWDLIQRLLLILRSDSHIQVIEQRIWSYLQLLALIGFVVFLVIVAQVGIAQELLIFAIPFGCLSLWISRLRTLPKVWESPYRPLVEPFHSFAALEQVWSNTPDYRKRRFPHQLRAIRRSFAFRIAECQIRYSAYPLWLLMGPLVLLFQLFPLHLTQTKVQSNFSE